MNGQRQFIFATLLASAMHNTSIASKAAATARAGLKIIDEEFPDGVDREVIESRSAIADLTRGVQEEQAKSADLTSRNVGLTAHVDRISAGPAMTS